MSGAIPAAATGPESAQQPGGGPRIVRPTEQSSFKAVLSNGPFLRLWLAQLISQTANSMVDFSLLLAVSEVVQYHDIPQANTAISLVILAFSLPGVIFGPFAGAVADRVDRRLLMAVVNFLRAGGVFFYLAIQTEWRPGLVLGAFYATTFLFGTAGQFFAPAQGAMIPELVPRAQLVQANALFNLTFTAAQLLGFTVVGPVAAKVLGIDMVFLLTAVLFFGCALLTLTLPKSKVAGNRGGATDVSPFRRLLADVREGLIFILNDPSLMRAIAYLTIASTTFMLVASLGPQFVTTVIGLSGEDIGYIVAPAGAGVVAGVLLVPRIVARFPREAVIDWSLALAGLTLLLLALSKSILGFIWFGAGEPPVAAEVAFAGSLAAFLGICNALVLVPAQTILQERSHDQIRARVYATFYTISNTVAFIPIFFAAAAADLFGVVQVLAAVAVMLLLVGGSSVRRRRREEAAQWTAVRTRHRQGPEALG
jgi:MFS family permease